MPSGKNLNCERCGGCGLLDEWGFAMEPCPVCNPTVEKSSIVAATVKPDLTVEPVSKPYKLDWTDQWDNCDVCECCGNLVSGGQLFNRLSLAVTMLYTEGAITAKERDAARNRLTKLSEKQK